MLYFQSSDITFSEVPNEVSLCIYLGGCSFRCKGCHSKWLWENRGKGIIDIFSEIDKYQKDITCVCIMGGEDFEMLERVFKYIKSKKLKACWYTAFELCQINQIEPYLDFLKIGAYNEDKGGLTSPTTNQKFYKITKDGKYIEYKFYEKRYIDDYN